MDLRRTQDRFRPPTRRSVRQPPRPSPLRALAALGLTALAVAAAAAGDSPYPPSPVIAGLTIDPERLSIGEGDNWPVTWGDTGDLYTVYCDGVGFRRGSGAGSMGQAKIKGVPPDLVGHNIFSPTGHTLGDGSSGRKASSLLMADGVLYMWVRNLYDDGTGASLAWSTDRAKTWTWESWAFSDIGYPVWLNAGQNYADAPDDYAYVYSPDGPSAYLLYEELLLARVPRDRITEPAAYQFFAGFDGGGAPLWDEDFGNHQPVFHNPAGCFRPSVVYNPALQRYLLCVTAPYDAADSYLGVFDAPTPWGPWTTVAYLDGWGAPENRFQPQIPAKWLSADGLGFYLLYSCFPEGPYQLNVQRCALKLK